MDQLHEMMEALAIDESSFFWYLDHDYEFDASQFFDFSVEETELEVQEADRWFRYARDYPPAPYLMKINLKNVSKSTPAKVHTIRSLKLEAVEHTSPATASSSSSDHSTYSSEGRTEDGSDLKYDNLIADIQKFRAKLKSTNKLSKSSPSTTFMTPTACHLAKIDAVDTHASSSGRSPKLQTPTGSEVEDIKRQKLEIGFLRKVSQLKHQTSFSHKTTTKATIAQRPRLMTEERAQMRRSQSKVEADNHTFKALPLNRKILESPSVPSHKKSMTSSREFQKFHFK